MHVLIEQKRDRIAGLCRRYGVLRLEVFGSAARGADFDPNTSDVDFLVSFDDAGGEPSFKKEIDFAEALKTLLGRPVDLVNPTSIANPFILASVNRAREVVYGT
jgi:predicted nucleotidyltransferase